MKVTTYTDKQLNEMRLMAEGVYPFEVTSAVDKISKAGNEMIELKLKVFKEDGGFNLINDYLLDSMAYKIRHACEACGLLQNYEAGQLEAADFVGKQGVVKIGIQKGDMGYEDRNQVKDYVVDKNGKPDQKAAAIAMRAPAPKKDDILGDDIPF